MRSAPTDGSQQHQQSQAQLQKQQVPHVQQAAFAKGDRVLYRQRDGTLKEAKVRHGPLVAFTAQKWWGLGMA